MGFRGRLQSLSSVGEPQGWFLHFFIKICTYDNLNMKKKGKKEKVQQRFWDCATVYIGPIVPEMESFLKLVVCMS